MPNLRFKVAILVCYRPVWSGERYAFLIREFLAVLVRSGVVFYAQRILENY